MKSSPGRRLSSVAARSLSVSSGLCAVPIQQVFRIASTNRDYEAALDRLEWHHQQGKLNDHAATLVWTVVAGKPSPACKSSPAGLFCSDR